MVEMGELENKCMPDPCTTCDVNKIKAFWCGSVTKCNAYNKGMKR
jgi:hypothetical protein